MLNFSEATDSRPVTTMDCRDTSLPSGRKLDFADVSRKYFRGLMLSSIRVHGRFVLASLSTSLLAACLVRFCIPVFYPLIECEHGRLQRK
jgi:hypothetical protein